MLKFNLILLVLAFASCQQEATQPTQPVAEKLKLESQQENSPEDVSYLARFETEKDAQTHVEAVKANGGEANLLNGSKTIVKSKVSRASAEKLNVPEKAKLAINSKISITKPQVSSLTSSEKQELGDAVMTAKKVVGVDKLRARKNAATGKGVTVAVFDTGIDFGLRGVSDKQNGENKLKGYFDLTDFGRTKLTKEENLADAKGSLKIGDKELRLAKNVKFKKIFAKGKLSEKDLAREYLTPQVDLNNNKKHDDVYLYAVGVNKDDQTAIWIDVDGDGKIDNVDNEELTDFNTTGKFVLLRTDASPSGAKPLAVTVYGEDDIQFHTVEGGHGTSCAIVIGGSKYANGFLDGMSPDVQFVSYMLDVIGQDVYTVDQFMEMFLHAREQKVDAISISWGFTVANLESARFFSNFLDEEIASQGILIAIAAGNEGPATSSGYTTDYMPHNGFAVGAMVSADQAKNVYGWNGDVEDSVIWYSSFGPTRGGRQTPDVISPLMTMVRGERKADGTIFRGFGGTSSATPALVGAVSSIMSQLKADNVTFDARILKMAVLNTADPIDHVPAIRQGRGVINVDAAYDLYLKLIAEVDAAKADKNKATRFPYELRAETKIDGIAAKGEGLVLNTFTGSKTIQVSLTKSTLAMIDKLELAEPLNVEHGQDFLATNDVVLLQATGANFSVEFDAEKLAQPGLYQDTIRLVRADDGVSLLEVPVSVRISKSVHSSDRSAAKINSVMTMNDQVRSMIHLTEDSALQFKGVALDHEDGFGTYLGFFVQSYAGDIVYQSFNGVSGAATSLDFKTPKLKAGQYELVAFRGGSRPAVVTPLTVSGAWSLVGDEGSVLAKASGNKLLVSFDAGLDLNGKSVRLKINKEIHELVLSRNDELKRAGFVGEIDLALKGKVGIHVAQNSIDAELEPFTNVSMAISNAETSDVMYRGWINFYERGNPFQEVSLVGEARKLQVLAYPNIVDWKNLQTDELILNLEVALTEAKSLNAHQFPEGEELKGRQRLTFELDGLPAHGAGVLEVVSKNKTKEGEEAQPKEKVEKTLNFHF